MNFYKRSRSTAEDSKERTEESSSENFRGVLDIGVFLQTEDTGHQWYKCGSDPMKSFLREN